MEKTAIKTRVKRKQFKGWLVALLVGLLAAGWGQLLLQTGATAAGGRGG